MEAAPPGVDVFAVMEALSVAIRVFLVEDMKHLQGVVADLLHSVGRFNLVGCAATEAEAIQWLADHPKGWDLLVIDLVLDQGTGMNLIARTKLRAPNARVVVFSDYVTPGIREHCLQMGADAVIPKTNLPAFIGFCTQDEAA